MSDEKVAKKVIPGSGGCGCLLTIILVLIAFVAGVYLSKECRGPLDSLKEKTMIFIQEKLGETKEKVQ